MRRLAWAGILLLLIPALAWTVWWWWAASAVERGALDWMEARRAEGALVEHQGLRVEGFPFALRATVEAPHLAMRGMEWRGVRLVAEAPAWDYRRIALTLPGEQRASVAQAGLVPLELLSRGGGTGHALLTGAGQPLELQLGFTDLMAQPEAAPTAIAALGVTVRQPAEPPATHKETGLSLALTATGITLPEGLPDAVAGPLGRSIPKLEAAARIQGRPPRIEPPSLSAWSRDGGTVELDRLALDWGPAAAALNGTLALDEALQPQGALSAELRGADKLLAAVEPQLPRNQVTLARTVVAMLSRPGADGTPVIQAPVTLQNGALFLGPLKLMPLPRFSW
ncbi:DUF2125 domain-containing protein [Azospirillum sp. SYSU D00513]|uniref:DUF2125 domain-containing protein n=1 Tax=Azospirillum sp. SYSU D00513 TaxID=2812561 RepID=UPI001A978611